MNKKTVKCRVASADFEENTLTLLLPKDFWDNHKIKAGTTEITVGDGIIEINGEQK